VSALIGAFELVLTGAAAGLAAGGLWYARRADRQRTRRVALCVALAGPLLYGAWRGYLEAIRVDPETGRQGLVQVDVLLGCLAGGVVLSLLLGMLAGRWIGNAPT
jgi:hypothetical protein